MITIVYPFAKDVLNHYKKNDEWTKLIINRSNKGIKMLIKELFFSFASSFIK